MSQPIAASKQIGLLFDATRCIGCGECVKACKAEHGQVKRVSGNLDADNFTTVKKSNGQFIRRLCMHCLMPTCVSVCPVAALQQQPDGQVTYDASACMGCRYCMVACPFSIPRYEWDRRFPTVQKCDFCINRTTRGAQTACSWVCPTGATQSGVREKLLAEARRRIEKEPERYQNHIYGEQEAGGTSVLILSGLPMEKTGYQTDIYTEALPQLTWRVLEKLPYVVLNGGLMLGGLWWITNRRMMLMQQGQGAMPRPGTPAAHADNQSKEADHEFE